MIELGFFFIDIDLTMHLNIIVPLINLCLLRVFKFILFITTKHVGEMIDVSHNLINGFKFEPENVVVLCGVLYRPCGPSRLV